MRRRRSRFAAVGALSLLAVVLLVASPSSAIARSADDVTPDAAPHAFPSASSTVIGSVGFINANEVGYFWSAARGDSVTETFQKPKKIKHAILDVEVVTNVLSNGAHVDWNLVINNQIVGSFSVPQGFVGPIHLDTTFASIAGPTYTVAIKVTNEVAGGEGSVTLAYAGPYAHSIKLKRH